MSSLVISQPDHRSMSLLTLARYTTDRSWHSIFEQASRELEHIAGMLDKAQNDSLDSSLPTGTWLYYPLRPFLFRALYYTPLDQVKVILLMMDPYPGRNPDGTPQACGLASSCEHSIPDTLRNILNELKRSHPDFVLPAVGDLRPWAKRGVLLLNASLTFLPSGGISGQKQQQQLWEPLVHRLIGEVTLRNKNLAICLWGRDAQRYQKYVNGSHLVLTASHPSPRSFASTDEPFRGCGHFAKIDEYLGERKIDWTLE